MRESLRRLQSEEMYSLEPKQAIMKLVSVLQDAVGDDSELAQEIRFLISNKEEFSRETAQLIASLYATRKTMIGAARFLEKEAVKTEQLSKVYHGTMRALLAPGRKVYGGLRKVRKVLQSKKRGRK